MYLIENLVRKTEQMSILKPKILCTYELYLSIYILLNLSFNVGLTTEIETILIVLICRHAEVRIKTSKTCCHVVNLEPLNCSGI